MNIRTVILIQMSENQIKPTAVSFQLLREKSFSAKFSAGANVFFRWHYICSCSKHHTVTKYIGIMAWCIGVLTQAFLNYFFSSYILCIVSVISTFSISSRTFSASNEFFSAFFISFILSFHVLFS